MQKRHTDRKQYFIEQGITTVRYVIPYLTSVMKIGSQTRVLEIGCGEGGNMVPFIKNNCEVVGIDLNKNKIEKARKYIAEIYPTANVNLILKDIYKVDNNKIGRFDLIIMRDVIEHIHNQERFMGYLKNFLKEDGKIFFGFPPWRMPFGGHQQTCKSKLLSVLPYFHILPKNIYRFILRVFGENKICIESLLEIKETAISTARFEKIVRKNNYVFLKKDLFFINPNYEVKFGLKPRKLFNIIGLIPHFRDFFTSCYYCIISMDKK